MSMDDNLNKLKKHYTKNKNIFHIFLFFVVALIIYTPFRAPLNNKDVIIHISSLQSINSVSLELENKNAIRNDFTLKLFIKLLKKGTGIISGDYLIERNSPVFVVAWQIGRGHHKIEPIKVTIREGLTNDQIATLLEGKLSGFNKDLFLSSVNNKQGYLFPDTYFFFPLDTTEEIIKKLSDNFENKIKSINSSINESGKSLNDIIIMASILEGEASGKEDIEIISGILWKRISINMPLQVDVDKSTYTKKGLPDNPLNNPGLMSIKASVTPQNSSYLYYLHDKNGKAHFAVTFAEHKRNIDNYLK